MCSPFRDMKRTGSLCLLGVMLVACQREERNFQGMPPSATSTMPAARQTGLQPGPPVRSGSMNGPYEQNAYGVSQGKTLYNSFNCSGCHFQGGGGIGPPLMDDEWVYGSRPENIFET
ncbi:MAG: c-type cytochrome, partial [Gemmatimonadales bacterium]